MKINPSKIRLFKKTVWSYYKKHKRDLPWRHTFNPYHIFISEVMLQQTQVSRVLVKYQEFITAFPSFVSLSRASLSDVLRVWQGMGYNRRGKYLREAAIIVTTTYKGKLPQDTDLIDSLPGIGLATACSIMAFAFNFPTVFIETNIRRVFIHHFFKDEDDIDDKRLLPLVESSLDREDPREWYWALMDYGTYLGKKIVNPNRKSKHYALQSDFKTSDRRIRGIILKNALKRPITIQEVIDITHESKERMSRIIESLVREGFLVKNKGKYGIQ